MLLHTEYSLLSLLHTQDGVVHHHGLFQVSGCLSPPLPVLPPWAGTCWGHICTLGSSPLRPLHAGTSGLLGLGGREGRLSQPCSSPAVPVTAQQQSAQFASYSLSL